MAKRSKTKKQAGKVRGPGSPTKSLALSWRLVAQVLALAAVTLWIYLPVLHGDWLWDDDKLVINNAFVVDPANWWKIWLEPGKLLDYQPLGISFVWLEWRLWGADTLGYHLVNVLFHILGALLVWRLLAKLGLQLAWLGGLLFAVHPLLVESVAWISEFKNTLSLPPFLLAMICWIDYEEHGRRKDYLLALGLFLIAMLVKPSMVMFPIVILLYAWWKRGRVGRSDLKASAPFFAVSLVLGLVTVWFVHYHGLTQERIMLNGPMERLALAGSAFAFYFSKCLLPAGLLPIYPQWPLHPLTIWPFLPWLVILGVIYFLWTKRAEWGRHALLGLGFFLLMLLPFVGFTTGTYMEFTWVMDHLVYIPIIGLIGLAVAGAGALGARLSPRARSFGAGLVALVLGVFVVESHGHAQLFVNLETLWTYTLRYVPDAYPAHNNLGFALARTGRLPDAIDQFRQALRLKPNAPEVHDNLGSALGQEGRFPEAVDQYEQALQANPDFAGAHYNLGVALQRLNRNPEAIDQYQQVVRLAPDYAQAHNNLGNLLAESGRFAEAEQHYRAALRLNPRYLEAIFNLGNTMARQNRYAEATAQYEAVLQIDPDNVPAQANLKQMQAAMEKAPPAR